MCIRDSIRSLRRRDNSNDLVVVQVVPNDLISVRDIGIDFDFSVEIIIDLVLVWVVEINLIFCMRADVGRCA